MDQSCRFIYQVLSKQKKKITNFSINQIDLYYEKPKKNNLKKNKIRNNRVNASQIIS